MVDITIFELHLPEAQFNAPFAGRTASGSAPEADTATGDDPEPGEDSRGRAIAAVLAVVGLALLAWYLRRSRADAGDGPGV